MNWSVLRLFMILFLSGFVIVAAALAMFRARTSQGAYKNSLKISHSRSLPH